MCVCHRARHRMRHTNRRGMRGWGLVKCLPCKWEDWNLIPRIHMKILGIVACICKSQNWGDRDERIPANPVNW